MVAVCNLFFCDLGAGYAILNASRSQFLCELLDRNSLDHATASVDHSCRLIVTSFVFSLWWEMKSRGGQSRCRRVKNVSVTAWQEADSFLQIAGYTKVRALIGVNCHR